MSTQHTIVQDKTFEVIKNTVNKMVDFIRPTYGAAANKIIISKQLYSMVVDDGVQAARDFELNDPVENAIVKLVRETAIKTNDRAGDGTTGSLIMLQALINEIARKSKVNGRKVEQELRRGLEEVKEQLRKKARTIKTKEDLKKVAMISFDDEKIADMIAELYYKMGKDSTITIDKSPTLETKIEMTEGVKIGNGYISPYMITNADRMETVLEKPYILLTDYRITEASDILPILTAMAKENKRELVIICENMEQSALATAVLNIVQGKFFVLAVCAPKGENRKVFLEDLALATGANVFTDSKGSKLEKATIADLGRSQRIIARQDETIIVTPKPKKKEDVQNAIQAIRKAISAEQVEDKRKELEYRLATFTNTLAVIKVGAATENEQKALRYKVEDAVNATKAAFHHGVVCGAGLALSSIKTSSPILNEALKYPAKQLRENMGIDEELSLKVDEALNVVTGKSGYFMDVGVMDPVDVLLAGVESAVSIASILVTSSGMIVESPKETKTE